MDGKAPTPGPEEVVTAGASPAAAGRWRQLAIGLICMMAISSPQYVWTLFTKPISAKLGVTLAELQVTFSILIVLQTFLSPLQGLLVDRFGPKRLLGAGAVLTGSSWILAAGARDLTGLYLTYGLLGGLGTGIVYIGVIGLMVKWFPDKRGLATGLVAAGYGMGAMLTTFPISASLAAVGYERTLATYGLLLGAIGLAAAIGLRRPPDRLDLPTSAAKVPSPRDVSPARMLRSPLFWLLFGMMTMMSTSGLMVISQMAAFARDFGIAQLTVLGVAALPLALTLDRLTNGLTRPFFGWLSDRIGRENTMFIAFALEGVAMTAWLLTRDDAVLFVLLSGLVFFGWGEIFSLFPSTLTDTFGARHATTNYGFLYMAQGVGSILGGPLAALLYQRTGTWVSVFTVVIAMNFATAVLALAVLKPARVRYLGLAAG
ncbi:MAG TPA: oxalate/formate MFS antiporter [Burkholderiales bacterium]|nr:oxalate/formate MFS antiporter [Burkholderiales bacterium]